MKDMAYESISNWRHEPELAEYRYQPWGEIPIECSGRLNRAAIS